MPEIKNSFLKGKMNKDFDERLVPNGEYRDALNVEISTSEDSNVGVVKSILGNHRVEDIISNDFVCVGTIANEKTNKLYWFVSSNHTDAIIEYDVENSTSNDSITEFVFVDKYVGTSRAVLKFTNKIITGINIIDDLLLWTDNENNPRKININECKKGTVDMSTHTQLIFDEGSFSGITLDLITGAVDADGDSTLIASGTFPFTQVEDNGERVWYERKQLDALLGQKAVPPGFATSNNNDTIKLEHKVKHYRNKKFLGVKNIIVFDDPDDATSAGTYFNAVDNFTDQNIIHDAWEKGDVIFGNDITVDIEERHITLIKSKPLNAFSVKINHEEQNEQTSSIPNLFETKFPRFAYRYKYKDGEFSPFSPFTHPVFNAKYPKDINASSDTTVFHNQDNVYDVDEPHNKAMVNSIHSIELTDFINSYTPEDVIAIEILCKQEESPIIYSIDTIKRLDKEWHSLSNHEGAGLDLGLGKSSEQTFATDGSITKGKYILSTENIYAALPSNQLLRASDNVPRKALAQEVTGNRVVYGNYVQNYDIENDLEISVSYIDRKGSIDNFTSSGVKHVKSQRNYQLGVVYSDAYGRETPVFTSSDGAINIPWQDNNGNINASRSLQLSTSVANNFPEWVDSFKYFIKEVSNPYYNLLMDRAWVGKSTYELDDSKGHMWISFASSDRNKISEEDYIILKKKIGTGEKQIQTENKFKVIDIQNTAPEACKYQLVNYGQIDQNGSNSLTSDVFLSTDQRIDKEVDTIQIEAAEWKSFSNSTAGLFGGVVLEEDSNQTSGPIKTTGLYICWRRTTNNNESVSKKYKIVNGNSDGTTYTLKLATKITKIDADIAHLNGDSSDTSQANMHGDLLVQIERRVVKDEENFSGKFFVKISKNQITDLIDNGNTVNVLDQFQVTSKVGKCWYWQDDIPGVTQSAVYDENNVTNYGLMNYTGHVADHATDPDDSIHDVQNNNNVGDVDANGEEMKVTDYADPWEGIEAIFGPTFFVDSMHMAAGQSEVSNYAKYCCVTWAGCTEDEQESAEKSSWSYPPLKTWVTDFEDLSGLKEKAKKNSIWYTQANNGEFISTSPVIPQNGEWRNQRIDGWVGPLQTPIRNTPSTLDSVNENHINGLEGIVTTSLMHAVGPRRWLSGITRDATENGVGVDTKTYSNNGEIDRHFMHLSFFAPGRDLVPDDIETDPKLFGKNSWAANLQGIWGGGVFTGRYSNELFGTHASKKHRHLLMEGNHDEAFNYKEQAPKPGVGYGYNLKYKERHLRQWDPTFNVGGDPDNKIRDFIRNLFAGAKFRFNKVGGSLDTEVYTIKKVTVKKLYNHTSWRKAYNRYLVGDGYTKRANDNKKYWSVEQSALDYLSEVDGNGNSTDDTKRDLLKNKIKQFGAADNRRICYILELDKSPTDATFNPLDETDDIMSADYNENNFCDIEFLDPVKDVLLSDLSKFPAIWELDPKKQEVDLDIYFEASGNIPVKINDKTNELFAPVGCNVEVASSVKASSSILESWDGSTAKFDPGFPKYDIDPETGNSQGEIDYSEMLFRFVREDGSYTTAEVEPYTPDGAARDFETEFKFKEKIGDNIISGLSWYNSFSFGNGVESNRIRDDFNEIFIANGVKASTTTQEIYEEERRSHGLIYSGLYNSSSGVNDLNQFITAEKITKDLNPTFGSIQKLFQRRISLIAFCEDRVVSIVSNKDTIFNADGNPQLVASDKVLGDANPFSGDYGISTNPESFAKESFRTYFTDKQRGAVLRLSKDGLTPISKSGMHDWFRDNLDKYNSLIGTYDSYKEDYNLTLSNNSFSENIIIDSFVETGGEVFTIDDFTNRIQNPTTTGTSAIPYYAQYDVLDVNSSFNISDFTADSFSFKSSATIVNHAAINEGDLQAEVAEVATSTPVAATTLEYDKYTDLPNSGDTYNGTFWNVDDFSSLPVVASGGTAGQWDNSLPITDHKELNANIRCTLTPHYPSGVHTAWDGTWGDPAYYRDIHYPLQCARGDANTAAPKLISRHITRAHNNTFGGTYNGFVPTSYLVSQFNTNTTGDECIVFDRTDLDAYLEFKDFGAADPVTGLLTGELNSDYRQILIDRQADPTQLGAQKWDNTYMDPNNITHSTFWNGDELLIEFELIHYSTAIGHDWSVSDTNSNKSLFGRNYCEPRIELFDGSTAISATKFTTKNSSNVPWVHPYYGWTAYYGPRNSAWYDSQVTAGSINGVSYPNNPYRSHEFWVSSSYRSNRTGLMTYHDPKNGFFDMTDVAENEDGDKAFHAFWADDHSTQMWSSGSWWLDTNDTIKHPLRGLHHTKFDPVNLEPTGFQYQKVMKYAVMVKFQDPNQTDDSVAITPKIVVEDLRIRLNQTKDIQSTWYKNDVARNLLKRPLFALKSFKIRKVKGIQSDDFQGTTINTITQIHVPAVPPVDIPAWNEVQYNHFDKPTTTWTIVDDSIGGPNNVVTEAETAAIFGDNRGAIEQTGNEAGVLVLGNEIKYSIPEGSSITYDALTEAYSYSDTWPGTEGSLLSGGFDFNRVTAVNNVYTGTDVFHDNLYIDIQSFDVNSATDVKHNMLQEPFSVGVWYLVDVEYDDTININTGLGSGDGEIAVYGVASTGSFNDDEVISVDGVGEYFGDNTNAHCKLIQTIRTEYDYNDSNPGIGDGETVLRGIFQVASDSYLNTNNELDQFTLRVIGCTNKIHIKKIIVKKLAGLPTLGTINNWTSLQQAIYNPIHSFSNNSIYINNDQLCFQMPAETSGSIFRNVWYQDIANPSDIYETAWNFSFTVNKNPITNNFSGNLSGTVAVSSAGVFRAMLFKDIKETGNYLISFELKQDDTPENWKIYREDLGVAVTTNSTIYTDGTVEDDLDLYGWNESNAGNKVQFYNTLGEITAQEYSITNIELIPVEQSIITGSIGAWNITGFSAPDQFVFLDNVENRFVFDDCPIQDDGTQFININQQINQNIKQNEQYRISFTHGITSGEIDIYYYNKKNYGFRISGIDSTSNTNFSEIITIGQDIWNPTQGTINGTDYSPDGLNFTADLKNSIVVVAKDNNNLVNGFIDNISMVRVYVDTETIDKTITFNEAVNGWSSFKSFVPENGVSLSKKYFTFKNGALWKHYVPKIQGEVGAFDSDGFFVNYSTYEADNYNVFYDIPSYSSITSVINQDPSLVKTFNTINYEGSQANIIQPINESEVTVNNANAWVNQGNVLGWQCAEIKTDLDAGSVIEFVKKEGKWFNYIKGLNQGQVLDTSKFSVQGIGIISSTNATNFTGVSIGSIDTGNGGGGQVDGGGVVY